jgi:hypothetical protein
LAAAVEEVEVLVEEDLVVAASEVVDLEDLAVEAAAAAAPVVDGDFNTSSKATFFIFFFFDFWG